jgi:hypothetical protein
MAIHGLTDLLARIYIGEVLQPAGTGQEKGIFACVHAFTFPSSAKTKIRAKV